MERNMPDIRYVCFSDMHFGADNSLLTNLRPGSIDTDPTKPSPVLMQLVACAKELISRNQQRTKPTLILNGDILELALATDNIAAMAFERFIELIMPANDDALFDPTIIYIPGNHDHHFWETGRETQYVNFISRKPWGDFLEIPWHTTNMFAPDRVPAQLLNGLMRRYPHSNGAQVTTVYPNFGLVSANGQKCVIFSHGHFTEAIYMLMTTLRTIILAGREKPRFIWDFEAENFAWIDFFWSTLGRSGEVGSDVALIYDKLQDAAAVKQLISNLATSLAEKFGLPHWADRVEAALLKAVLEGTLGRVARLERQETGKPLSPDGEAGLRAYLEGPVCEQILLERGQTMPLDVTFVFGHTHKPFQRDMQQLARYPDWVSIYNSGGWVVDTVNPEPLHGGAAILVDEDFNTASLRLYNEAADPKSYSVRVKTATHPHAAANPFHQRLVSLVDVSKDPWKAFSDAVAHSVPIHAENLRTAIQRRA